MQTLNVYKNLSGVGYLLDIQSALLCELNTRVVVPLMPAELSPQPAKVLNPTFEIEKKQVVMLTQHLVALPVSELKEPVTDLNEYQQVISQALHILHKGI